MNNKKLKERALSPICGIFLIFTGKKIVPYPKVSKILWHLKVWCVGASRIRHCFNSLSNTYYFYFVDEGTKAERTKSARRTVADPARGQDALSGLSPCNNGLPFAGVFTPYGSVVRWWASELIQCWFPSQSPLTSIGPRYALPPQGASIFPSGRQKWHCLPHETFVALRSTAFVKVHLAKFGACFMLLTNAAFPSFFSDSTFDK